MHVDRINLFYIVAHCDQTAHVERQLLEVKRRLELGKLTQVPTLIAHFCMLSQFFNLKNFFQSTDFIEKTPLSLIYHIPNGRDDEHGVEIALERYKGKIPIIMRSYDPHSPEKTDAEYMRRYHDLTITYLRERVDGESIVFGNNAYDNHLFGEAATCRKKRSLACMILRYREGTLYREPSRSFSARGLTLSKTYDERLKVSKLRDVHIFGRGWPAKQRNFRGGLHPHAMKYRALSKYRYNFILENAIADNYISEKILDSFLALAVPVYLGSPAAESYIPNDTFVPLRLDSDYPAIIQRLRAIPPQEYDSMLDRIESCRSEVFDRFSTKETIAKPIYRWYALRNPGFVAPPTRFFEEQEDYVRRNVHRDSLSVMVKSFLLGLRLRDGGIA